MVQISLNIDLEERECPNHGDEINIDDGHYESQFMHPDIRKKTSSYKCICMWRILAFITRALTSDQEVVQQFLTNSEVFLNSLNYLCGLFYHYATTLDNGKLQNINRLDLNKE